MKSAKVLEAVFCSNGSSEPPIAIVRALWRSDGASRTLTVFTRKGPISAELIPEAGAWRWRITSQICFGNVEPRFTRARAAAERCLMRMLRDEPRWSHEGHQSSSIA